MAKASNGTRRRAKRGKVAPKKPVKIYTPREKIMRQKNRKV